ncbi:hypothetical protein BH11ACT1_BH11ACT1_18050 [soil metagenome]
MSTTTTAPETTITHPAWCDLDLCSADDGDGVHWAPDLTINVPSGSAAAPFTIVAALSRVDDCGDVGQAGPYLNMNGQGACTLDQLDELARWLTTRVSEYRQAIATEGGAR